MSDEPIRIDGKSLTLDQVADVSRGGTAVQLDPGALERVVEAARFVEVLVAQGEPVYGVNTGVGGLSSRALSTDAIARFQQNLVRSNAAGVGEPMPRDVVRALMLLRSNTLAAGFSGVTPEVLQLLIDLLNLGVTPIVPSQGSVGASGDLAPLAHVALVLIGSGEAHVDGERVPGREAMHRKSLVPVTLRGKDGSALINGTQAITAYGALATYDADCAVQTADIVAALTLEALRGVGDAFDARIHAVRPHPGQMHAAQFVRELIAGSERLRAPSGSHLHDAYSLRCIPQVHGAGRDVLTFARQTVTIELNSVSDNPLVFPAERTILSGGNFHGEGLGYVLDSLGIAMVGLMNIAERRIARLTDEHLSGLPAFLAVDDGMSSGMMVAQYTAAALVSEGKVLATPSSIDSIPTSANQEDYVSMALFSARKVSQILTNVWNVLAVEALCAAQAIDMRPTGKLGRGTQAAYDVIRDTVRPLDADRELSPDILRVASVLSAGLLLDAVKETLGY